MAKPLPTQRSCSHFIYKLEYDVLFVGLLFIEDHNSYQFPITIQFLSCLR